MIRNSQFLFNQADSHGLLYSHDLIILTKSHKDLAKFVNFLLKAHFWSWELFYETPSSFEYLMNQIFKILCINIYEKISYLCPLCMVKSFRDELEITFDIIEFSPTS